MGGNDNLNRSKTMKTATEIRNFLAQCYGSDRPYIKHSLVKRLVMTDTVGTLREMADCFWLVDVIASYQSELLEQPFQVWQFKCNTELKLGTVTCEDGNGNELVRQEIEYTDFPLDELTLWAELGGYGSEENWTPAMVLMVPSER
jgi:hypothetical protein